MQAIMGVYALQEDAVPPDPPKAMTHDTCEVNFVISFIVMYNM
jgi:hypothetical protein